MLKETLMRWEKKILKRKKIEGLCIRRPIEEVYLVNGKPKIWHKKIKEVTVVRSHRKDNRGENTKENCIETEL